MNLSSNYSNPYVVAEATASDRAAFIRNTYQHLAGALAALVAIECAIFAFVPKATLAALTAKMFGGLSWLLVLGAFMVVSMIANKWAYSGASRQTQYMGLGLYTVAQAIILLPLLFIAQNFAGNGVIANAAWITMALFVGLSAVVLITKKDFSFLRSALTIGFFVALGLIIAGAVFGFSLGLWFAGAMILLMSCSILYTTSQMLHHFNTNQHVAASLALFASVATLFWYVLQFLLAFASSD